MLPMFIIFMMTVGIKAEITLDQLSQAITRVCPPKVGCPEEEFGIFKDEGWSWNFTAIKTSAQSKELMKMALGKPLAAMIKDVYCCRRKDCLERCFARNYEEISLVKEFPKNARSLLDLQFAPFDEHRVNVEKWLESFAAGKETKGDYPSEIEDFLDNVHNNQHVVTQLLNAEKNRKKIFQNL